MLIVTEPKWSDDGRAVKLPLTAVPLSMTDCGLPVTLSVINKLPEIVPGVVGAKDTWTVQELPGATRLSAQLSDSLKPEVAVTVLKVTLEGELAGTETVTG
ncbi:MAG: hypothetical protein WCA38_15275 [Candidatus Acidiferrales bacterium]